MSEQGICGEGGALCGACSLWAHDLTQEPGCGAPIAATIWPDDMPAARDLKADYASNPGAWRDQYQVRPDPGAASFAEERGRPIYGEGYERTGRSVKRSHRAEGRNFVD